LEFHRKDRYTLSGMGPREVCSQLLTLVGINSELNLPLVAAVLKDTVPVSFLLSDGFV